MKVLVLQASSRREGSTSRELSQFAIDELKSKVPSLEIVTRDLGNGLPALTSEYISKVFTPEQELSSEERKLLALSEELIEELKAADLIIAAVPMYNFSVPSNFKIWIDYVCRARKTFAYTETGPKGLLEGKLALVLTAMGGPWEGTGHDFLIPYLKTIFNFIGIDNQKIINAQGQAMPSAQSKKIAAKAEINKWVQALEV